MHQQVGRMMIERLARLARLARDRFIGQHGDTDSDFTSGLACALNATHTVDLKFDGVDLLGYLDGVLVASVPITESMAAIEAFAYLVFITGAAAVGPMIDRLVFDQPPAF